MCFQEAYNKLKSEFENEGNFTCINKLNKKPIDWPQASGVYVIWHNFSDNGLQLVYVGMTGKYTRNEKREVIFNNSLFQSRSQRWTPYRFCENELDKDMKYHFRFGPKESNTKLQAQIKFNSDAYSTSISYEELEIHCFHINENHSNYSPVLLESLILTMYLKSNKSHDKSKLLPPANNSL